MCPYLRLDLKDLQNAGLLCLPFHSHCAGPPCAHTRLSRGDEFRATFVAPSCYFRPSGMCAALWCGAYAGDVSRPPGSASAVPVPAAPLNNGRARRLRLRCVCHVRPILTVSPPSITAYPPPIHPGDPSYGPPSPPLHRRVKSWGLKSRLKSVLRISGFVVTTAVKKKRVLLQLMKAFPTALPAAAI